MNPKSWHVRAGILKVWYVTALRFTYPGHTRKYACRQCAPLRLEINKSIVAYTSRFGWLGQQYLVAAAPPSAAPPKRIM